jgi:hypothetical protein
VITLETENAEQRTETRLEPDDGTRSRYDVTMWLYDLKSKREDGRIDGYLLTNEGR